MFGACQVVNVQDLPEFRNHGLSEIKKPFLVRFYTEDDVDRKLPIYYRGNGNKQTVAFKNNDSAYLWAKDVLFMQAKYVVAVLKNADFIEGRGPMVLDKIFDTHTRAHEYIMNQDGIYGSKQGISANAGVNVHGEAYAYNLYNGYEIEFKILD